MSSFLLAALVLGQAQAPATPSSAGPATSPPSASDTGAADPTVCRSVDVSGSAFPRKECHRLSTWVRLDRQN